MCSDWLLLTILRVLNGKLIIDLINGWKSSVDMFECVHVYLRSFSLSRSFVIMDLILLISNFLLRICSAFMKILGYITFLILSLKYRRKKPSKLPPISNEILLLPAVILAERMRSRKLTCVQVVTAYVQRIYAVNGTLNAVVGQDLDKVLREAKRIDTILDSKVDKNLAEKQPFLGVPITIKECYRVKGLKQTLGMPHLKHYISKSDAEIVRVMKEAGAIVLGVTNVSQLLTSWESVNPVYGRTNNPYDTRRIAGGTSGGEGSILGAAGSVIGIGSDVAGSIRIPALCCGIFGHKPSKGIVSNDGMQPQLEGENAEMMVTGPICRYAIDLIPMLKIMASTNRNKLKLDQNVDIKKLKVYYMEDCGSSLLVSSVSRDVKMVQKKVIQHFKDVHGITAQEVNLRNLNFQLHLFLGALCKIKYISTLYTHHLSNGKGKPNMWKELMKYVMGQSDYTLASILSTWLESILTKFDLNSVMIKRDGLKADLENLLRDDAIFLYPTLPSTAVYHGQPLVQFFDMSYTGIFNVLGVPVTHCPLGLDSNGLPVGIQVVASTFNDHLTLAVARDLEIAFGGWVWPV